MKESVFNTKKFKIALYSISSIPRYIEEYILRPGLTTDTGFPYNTSFSLYDNRANRISIKFIYELIKNVTATPHKRILSVTKELKQIAKEHNLYFISYNKMIKVKYSDLGDHLLVGMSSENNIPILFNIAILFEYINGVNIVKSVDIFKNYKGIIGNEVITPYNVNDYTCINYNKVGNDYYIGDIMENSFNKISTFDQNLDRMMYLKDHKVDINTFNLSPTLTDPQGGLVLKPINDPQYDESK